MVSWLRCRPPDREVATKVSATGTESAKAEYSRLLGLFLSLRTQSGPRLGTEQHTARLGNSPLLCRQGTGLQLQAGAGTSRDGQGQGMDRLVGSPPRVSLVSV
jgi:hypothetical protein